MNLNIIGNGFDLYHGLPSSYYYFGCFLINTDPEFYEEIGKMYTLKYMEMVGTPLGHEYGRVVEDIFWSDFESYLAKVDDYFVVESSIDDLGLEYPDPVWIELKHDHKAGQLKQKFSQWVKETIDIDSNYNLIKEFLLNDTAVNFGKGDYFLQFNFTHSLQNIYGIKNDMIHYVHGECLKEDGSELIVGHGNDERIKEVNDIIRELNEKYNYTQSSINRINEYRCLERYIRKLRKDVPGCMKECSYFFNTIEGSPRYINIYGLSLGEVDIPYLRQIRHRWPKARWRFSFYSESDKERNIYVAENDLGLKEDEFKLFSFEHSLSNFIRSKIVMKSGIEEYRLI